MDLFGDGWGSAQLYIYDNYGSYQVAAPTCGQNPLMGEYCFDPNYSLNGDSVSAYVFGFDVSYAWEILWIAHDSISGNSFTGTIETKMTFTYTNNKNYHGHIVPTVTLTSSENLQPSHIDCMTCDTGPADVPTTTDVECGNAVLASQTAAVNLQSVQQSVSTVVPSNSDLVAEQSSGSVATQVQETIGSDGSDQMQSGYSSGGKGYGKELWDGSDEGQEVRSEQHGIHKRGGSREGLRTGRIRQQLLRRVIQQIEKTG